MPMQPLTITVTYWRKSLWRRLADFPQAFRTSYWWMRGEGANFWISLCGAWVLTGYEIRVG